MIKIYSRLACLVFWILLAVCITGPQVAFGQLKSVPIQRYSCLSKQFDTDKWLLEGKRTFDAKGILQQNKQYHPLGIAFLGIMRYDDFLRTGDSLHYQQCIDQYQYFADSGYVMYFDSGRGMGLPYRFAFSDLKAPWFSGMTQGAGLSYLTRYYDLTHDTTAFHKMVKVAHHLMQPIQSLGCTGKTPEGYRWIEEYPNSKSSPGVLNGFINGWIGLHEYCQRFPSDTAARRLCDDTFDALRLTVGAYDTENWTDYHRTKHSVIRDSYMRYELAEFEHLLELRPDAFLEPQMMIWSMMAFTKIDSSLRCYRMPKYQFAYPLVAGDKPHLMHRDSVFQLALRPLPLNEMLKRHKKEVPMLAFQKGKQLELKLKSPVHVLYLDFANLKEEDTLFFEAEDAAGAKIPLRSLRVGASLRVSSEAAFTHLEVNSNHKLGRNAGLTQAKIPDYDSQYIPKFGYVLYKTVHRLKAGEALKFDFEFESITNAKLFYRNGHSGRAGTPKLWQYENVIPLPCTDFVAPIDGDYEFFMSFPYLMPDPKVLRFEIKKV